MSDLTKTILESGIIDEATASLMERWGIIDADEADLVKKEKLKDAGREELTKFAETIETELEKKRKLRETMLDLNQLRWPVTVIIRDPSVVVADGIPSTRSIARVDGVIDRMGRYYFRPADVRKNWFVPGYTIERHVTADDGVTIGMRFETILEVSDLYVGEHVAAIQVSTQS